MATSTLTPGPENVPLTDARIRAQLERMLAAPVFSGSERPARFLRFVVEEALQGRGDRLKESVIGVEVFGRKPDYDPRIDAVVRIEASKLRAKIKEYYEADPETVRIDLPKGGYVPAFSLAEAGVPADALQTAQPAGLLRRPWMIAAAFVAGMLAMAGAWYLRRGPAAFPEAASIAVLPFVDLSAEKDQEYLCDGVTEQIIDSLARVNGFHVVARTSVFALKGSKLDVREVGQRLKVRTVLEGSIRKSGDRLRVTAQLVNVTDGYHVWSETYERDVKDVFRMEDEISQAIVHALSARIETGPPPASTRTPTNDMEAYRLFLQGRYFHSKWVNEGEEKAIQYFEQAIAHDPKYAEAYAGLADTYCWMGFFGPMAPSDAFAKARESANRALELNPSLSAAHISLGYVKSLYDRDWPGAEREFQRGIALNPGEPMAHFAYALTYLAPMGRITDARRELQMARNLDPLSLVINTHMGLLEYLARDYPQALVELKHTLEIDPTFQEAYDSMASVYMAMGQTDKAGEAMSHTSTSTWRAYHEAMMWALRGNRAKAEAGIAELRRDPTCGYVRPTSIACFYLALGDKKTAYEWLDRAETEHDPKLIYLKSWPMFDVIRTEERFQDLVKRLRLPQ